MQQAYKEVALQMLEADSNVMHYAWSAGPFPAQDAVNSLGSGGQLTALGEQNVNAPRGCR